MTTMFATPALFTDPTYRDEYPGDVYDLLISIRVQNMQDQLYVDDAGDCEMLETLVAAGLVVEVPATAGSLLGYVAVPMNDFTEIVAGRAVPAVSAPGGDC